MVAKGSSSCAWLADIFSQSVAYLAILLTSVLHRGEVVHFSEAKLVSFPFMEDTLGVTFKNLSPSHRS
jgi:hypothetical protein